MTALEIRLYPDESRQVIVSALAFGSGFSFLRVIQVCRVFDLNRCIDGARSTA